MKSVDIMESIAAHIEDKFCKEWKHEVIIGGFTSGRIIFEVDGQEYDLWLYEVKGGEQE